MAKVNLTLLRELVVEGDKKDKVPPQVQVIVKTLKGFGIGKPVDREDLVKKLEENANKPEGLQTRQPVSRIVSYYQSRMPEDLVKVETIKAEKPAAAGKDKTDAKPAKA